MSAKLLLALGMVLIVVDELFKATSTNWSSQSRLILGEFFRNPASRCWSKFASTCLPAGAQDHWTGWPRSRLRQEPCSGYSLYRQRWSLTSFHIGAQVFFRLFWWDFRWFTFSFTFFGDFSSEIFGDSPFSSPFLVTFPVMNFAIHYIHHRFWWLSCHLFCHFDISLSFYLFWPFFRWPFRQPYKFITIFGASLVTFFVLIFFLPFYSPFLGDFFGDRSFYPTHLSVSLLLCLRGSVKEFKTFFSSILQPFPTRVHKFLSVVYLVVLPPIMF